jgi:hypothetical protein
MGTKKITVALPEDQIEWVQALALAENISCNDVLRRSIKTEQFLLGVEKSGGKVLLENPDGSMSRLIRY